jgi:curved DNA-binding protein CbpA
MSVEEASDILGISPSADAEAVAEAYRRLMQRAHPDKGGSSGLAAQLNAARDVMNRRAGPPAKR